MFQPLFHSTVLVINSFVLWYDQMYIKLPLPIKEMEDMPLNARSMFLTMWCLILNTVYYFIALLNDIYGTNSRSPEKPPVIRQIKDILFVIAFPTAVYVSIAFWSIYNINKELICPEFVEKIYPPPINHVMHTTVSLFIIVELLTSYRNYPSKSTGLTIMFMYLISYIIWFFIIYVKTGAWVYPVFQPLNWFQRFIFIVLSLCMASVIYIIGDTLNSFIYLNRKELHTNGFIKTKKKI